MYQSSFLLVVFSFIVGCSGSQKINYQDIEKQLQTQLILSQDGDTIHLEEGHFKFSGSISLDDKKNIVIKGAGRDKTFLSFKGQSEGSEGLKISNCENLTLLDFTIQDSKGDCIKVQLTNGLIIRNVKAEWTGKPQETNGSYAFYPVDCENVLIEHCIAIGASDAGIYVGQSRGVIVRYCEAYHNVAGIEIENCVRADVYENLAHCNTGGILVFDMPDLTQAGSHVRVFNNIIKHNNFRNFAPEGNIVHEVPPGTGVMVLATNDVEIFDNQIINNKTIGTAIVSYLLVQKKHDDPNFDPYVKGVYVYNNDYKRKFWYLPTFQYDMGKLMFWKFPFSAPHIIFDGILNPELVESNGLYGDKYRICFGDNGGAKFANVDGGNDFKNVKKNDPDYQCDRNKLDAVVLNL